jgi:hypothetical protein
MQAPHNVRIEPTREELEDRGRRGRPSVPLVTGPPPREAVADLGAQMRTRSRISAAPGVASDAVIVFAS